MNSSLVKALQGFGLRDGLRLYLALKRRRAVSLGIPELAHPVALRPGTCDYAVFKQVFVRRELSFDFQEVVPEPSFIVDAGGHIGLASLFFANRYPEATIHAIEPGEDNVRVLRANTAPYANIEVFHEALWNRRTRLYLSDPGQGEWAYTTSEDPTDHLHAISAVTVADVMDRAGRDRIDILKIDIEGSEQEVFSVADSRWLRRTRLVVMEFHESLRAGSRRAVLDALAENRFEDVGRIGENCFFLNRSS
jgi:FkbM family methyltransferase